VIDDPFNLQRFLDAQAPVMDRVVEDLRNGRKQTHWMWFVFPQIAGLGFSATAQFYALRSLEEAKAYLVHPVLGPRILACTERVLAHRTKSARAIFGTPDDLKFRSSMTLFREASSGRSLFERALAAFFEGEPDAATLEKLRQ